MLYVTTRNHQEAFTVHQVLTQSCGPDSGLYIPVHLPKLSEQERNRLAAMTFSQCVSEMLNLFLGTKLTGWDVDFSIGRYPIRLEQLPHRIFMAETWHNLDRRFHRLEQSLRQLLHAEANAPGNWVSVAIRMAVLAGIWGSGELQGRGPVDLAVVTGDFTLPISAWYLRSMGFPVGNIIGCCNENNQFWNLICNGQIHTNEIALSTLIPEADVAVPVNLERLIAQCGSVSEAERFADCCRTGIAYSVSDNLLQKLRNGLYAGVVSSSRVATSIPNVYKTHQYIMSPSSALAYSGLLDYRAKTGIARTSVVLCDDSPACYSQTVADSMEIPVEELEKLL